MLDIKIKEEGKPKTFKGKMYFDDEYKEEKKNKKKTTSKIENEEDKIKKLTEKKDEIYNKISNDINYVNFEKFHSEILNDLIIFRDKLTKDNLNKMKKKYKVKNKKELEEYLSSNDKMDTIEKIVKLTTPEFKHSYNPDYFKQFNFSDKLIKRVHKYNKIKYAINKLIENKKRKQYFNNDEKEFLEI
jgi:hypothetical protein